MLKWIGLIFLTFARIQYSLFSNQGLSFLGILAGSLSLIGYPIIIFCVVKKFHHVKRPFCFFLRLGGLAVLTQLARLAVEYYPVVVLPRLNWMNNLLVPLALSVLMLTGFDLTTRSDCSRGIPGARTRFDNVPMRPLAGMALGVFLILISLSAALVLGTDSCLYWMLTALCLYVSYDREEEYISVPLLFFSMMMLNLGNIGVAWLARESVEIELIFCLSLLAVPLIGWLGNPSVKTSRPDRDSTRNKNRWLVRIVFYLWYPMLMVLLALAGK